MTLAECLQSSQVEEGHTIHLRRPMLRVCGDCGAQWTTNDTCQWCGGLAVPMTNRFLSTQPRKENG